MRTLYLIMNTLWANAIVRHFSSEYPNYTINLEITKDLAPETTFPDFSIAVCDTDAALRLAAQRKIPAVALSHEENHSEALSGTPWLILDISALTPHFLREVHCRFHGLPVPILRTARFALRELSMRELPALLALQTENQKNPAGCFFPEGCPQPTEFLSEYIHNQYAFYGYGVYGIFAKKSEAFVGIAGFAPLHEGVTEVGYSLLKRYHRLGIASEVLPPLLAFGEEYLGISHPVTRIPAGNSASLRLAEKCGLEVLPSYKFPDSTSRS